MHRSTRVPGRPGHAPAVAAFMRATAAVDDRSAAQAWRIAVATMLAARYLDHPVDLQRALEMALARALPGRPETLRTALDPDNGLHLHALLLELGTGGTSEARLVGSAAALVDGRRLGSRDRFLQALAAALAGVPDARAAG